MKNRILLFLGFLVCLTLFLPRHTFAAALDTHAEASLTLHYQKDGKAFSDLQVGIYRVAEAAEDGTFALIAPFSSYPVNIHNITTQEHWKNIATTFNAYIVADQIKPDREAQTDSAGTVRFANLKTGLYLVREAVAENTDGTYLFDRFMVYLPTPQPDGSYEYAVEAKPKCSNFVPKTQYTVTKLWQDTGSRAARPKEVTVAIYKDGVLQETQPLNQKNNWSYKWSVSGEDRGEWTVTEQNVPDMYQVTVHQNGSVFSITNTCLTAPETPPQTGDSFNPLPWVLILCISGALLVILGIYTRRRK